MTAPSSSGSVGQVLAFDDLGADPAPLPQPLAIGTASVR
jgi:hypothetical protein